MLLSDMNLLLPLLLIASASTSTFSFLAKLENVCWQCARAPSMILLFSALKWYRSISKVFSLKNWIYKSNENQTTRAYKSRDAKWLITFIILRVLNHISYSYLHWRTKRYQFLDSRCNKSRLHINASMLLWQIRVESKSENDLKNINYNNRESPRITLLSINLFVMISRSFLHVILYRQEILAYKDLESSINL